MSSVIVPDIETAWDLLGVEDVGHLLVYVTTGIIDGGCKNTGIATVGVKVAGIVHVGHVVGWQVEVTILIVVAGEEVRWIESASHRKNIGEDVGVPEGEIDGMIAPEVATDDREAGCMVPVADEGCDFMKEILLVSEVAGYSCPRDNSAVVPAFGIDRVDTKKLEMAMFDLVLNGVDQAAIFKVEESAARGRKGERWNPGMSEDEQLHLPPEGWR